MINLELDDTKDTEVVMKVAASQVTKIYLWVLSQQGIVYKSTTQKCQQQQQLAVASRKAILDTPSLPALPILPVVPPLGTPSAPPLSNPVPMQTPEEAKLRASPPQSLTRWLLYFELILKILAKEASLTPKGRQMEPFGGALAHVVTVFREGIAPSSVIRTNSYSYGKWS